MILPAQAGYVGLLVLQHIHSIQVFDSLESGTAAVEQVQSDQIAHHHMIQLQTAQPAVYTCQHWTNE